MYYNIYILLVMNNPNLYKTYLYSIYNILK